MCNLWVRVTRECSSAEADASNVARVLFDGGFEYEGRWGRVTGLGIVIWGRLRLNLISQTFFDFNTYRFLVERGDR